MDEDRAEVGPSPGHATGDVWQELFGIVKALKDTVDLSIHSFLPGSNDKTVSATTKKRMMLKAIDSLKQGKQNIELLTEHVNALKNASDTWQRTMSYASQSKHELMGQLESCNQELHHTGERLRIMEAQRNAVQREAEALRAQVQALEQERRALMNGMQSTEEDLHTAQFLSHEAQSELMALRAQVDDLKAEKQAADRKAEAAVQALDTAKAEASKATAAAARHQEVVAKLTADNLGFLMQLKKAEAELASANREKAALKLAAEQQRGPWFDEVRTTVEQRVKEAMTRAEQLEKEMEAMKLQHDERIQVAEQQKADLEEFVGGLQSELEDMRQQLAKAVDARNSAEEVAATASDSAEALRQRLEALSAENRVLQESVRNMRQECTERWVTEQNALAQVSGLEAEIKDLQSQLGSWRQQAAAVQSTLESQQAVNRQLMAKKEEVEWQLMAALAKDGGGLPANGPIPLNLQVSGLLQVDRNGNHYSANSTVPAEQGKAQSQLLVSEMTNISANYARTAGTPNSSQLRIESIMEALDSKPAIAPPSMASSMNPGKASALTPVLASALPFSSNESRWTGSAPTVSSPPSEASWADRTASANQLRSIPSSSDHHHQPALTQTNQPPEQQIQRFPITMPTQEPSFSLSSAAPSVTADPAPGQVNLAVIQPPAQSSKPVLQTLAPDNVIPTQPASPANGRLQTEGRNMGGSLFSQPGDSSAARDAPQIPASAISLPSTAAMQPLSAANHPPSPFSSPSIVPSTSSAPARELPSQRPSYNFNSDLFNISKKAPSLTSSPRPLQKVGSPVHPILASPTSASTSGNTRQTGLVNSNSNDLPQLGPALNLAQSNAGSSSSASIRATQATQLHDHTLPTAARPTQQDARQAQRMQPRAEPNQGAQNPSPPGSPQAAPALPGVTYGSAPSTPVLASPRAQTVVPRHPLHPMSASTTPELQLAGTRSGGFNGSAPASSHSWSQAASDAPASAARTAATLAVAHAARAFSPSRSDRTAAAQGAPVGAKPDSRAANDSSRPLVSTLSMVESVAQDALSASIMPAIPYQEATHPRLQPPADVQHTIATDTTMNTSFISPPWLGMTSLAAAMHSNNASASQTSHPSNGVTATLPTLDSNDLTSFAPVLQTVDSYNPSPDQVSASPSPVPQSPSLVSGPNGQVAGLRRRGSAEGKKSVRWSDEGSGLAALAQVTARPGAPLLLPREPLHPYYGAAIPSPTRSPVPPPQAWAGASQDTPVRLVSGSDSMTDMEALETPSRRISAASVVTAAPPARLPM